MNLDHPFQALQANIPLLGFQTPNDVLSYLDALIDSGIAAQVERGLIFVLGNTQTGKTSLVNTFKSFVESPLKEPTSVLTKPGDDLFETQVLEVYDNLSLKQEKTFKVSKVTSAPTLVKLEEEQVAAKNDSKKERLQLKIVDLGKLNYEPLTNKLILLCLIFISLMIQEDIQSTSAQARCLLPARDFSSFASTVQSWSQSITPASAPTSTSSTRLRPWRASCRRSCWSRRRWRIWTSFRNPPWTRSSSVPKNILNPYHPTSS